MLTGRKPWVADGTTGGTRIVRDVRPGGENSSIEPLGALRGHLYFTADDGVHGKELWRSDGTEAGTVLVKEIRAGPEGCVCPDAAIAFGRVFGAYDGSEFGLWSTDGTEAGTYSLGPVPGTPADGGRESPLLHQLRRLEALPQRRHGRGDARRARRPRVRARRLFASALLHRRRTRALALRRHRSRDADDPRHPAR